MKISLACSLAAFILAAGCGAGGKHTTTVYTKNGTTTVTTANNGKTTSIQSQEGQMTVGQGAVDASKLGAPIYPGATQSSDQAAANINVASGSSALAAFSTSDSFDKVYSWYKERMPAGSEKARFTQGTSSMAEFVTGQQPTGQTMVMVTQKGAQTQITITHSVQKRSP